MNIPINDHFQIQTDHYYDLSLEIFHGPGSDRAFGIGPARIEPYQYGAFQLEVTQGAAVNCFDVTFNPHGNGTHTECVGHILPEHQSVNAISIAPFMSACLISVPVSGEKQEQVVTLETFRSVYDALTKSVLDNPETPQALIIRTLPNDAVKQQTRWSGQYPPYMEPKLLTYIRQLGVQHFLTDLPSVDPEEDGGQLLAHRAFWNVPEAPRTDATISELLYIHSGIPDGLYILNLQTAAFRSDATPSRPLIFPLIPR